MPVDSVQVELFLGQEGDGQLAVVPWKWLLLKMAGNPDPKTQQGHD